MVGKKDGVVTVRVPGERICSTSEGKPGEGVYSREGMIYSALTGVQVIHEKSEASEDLPLVEVVSQSHSPRLLTPDIGQIVICRVVACNLRGCKCDIIGIEGKFLSSGPYSSGAPYHGLIRKEDIRASDKDRVDVYKCYRPGDIVLAKVTSMGESQGYVLTTAENELGVVYAKAESAEEKRTAAPMLPLSWCEMICPSSLTREPRKVARAQTRYLENYHEPTES